MMTDRACNDDRSCAVDDAANVRGMRVDVRGLTTERTFGVKKTRRCRERQGLVEVMKK